MCLSTCMPSPCSHNAWHTAQKHAPVHHTGTRARPTSVQTALPPRHVHALHALQTGRRWYYGKLTERELWKRYSTDRDRAQQPIQGNPRQLWKLWKSHREILERPPCGQDACNFCATNLASRDKLEGLQADPEVRARIAELDAEKRAHMQFNRTEREHYIDAVQLAEHRPHEMTCLTIDAPTRNQFDLPSQARKHRDKAKKLDPQNRWQSKVEGVLDAGLGMMAYVARSCIGGGANLVCTVLMLSLFCHAKLGRRLGHVLHVQLDNTTSENKNMTVIALIGLLVYRSHFLQGRLFFMHVGHTYNELDQTFSPLISEMLQMVMPTISSLLDYLLRKLAVQRVREVKDLPHLWNFEQYLQEHVNLRGGFANTQQSCGMHEMVLYKDAAGAVRIKMRQSSQASTWLPEGEGELLFLPENLPEATGAPPILPLAGDAHWHRIEVQSNVRRWLPYLGLTPTLLASAEKEWETVFSKMPAGGGAPSVQLQWEELPQAVLRGANSTSTSAAASDMVENPAVNPIHARSGRTYNTVRAELRVHQEDLRADAASAGEIPPIFLSEYVFFKPKGGPSVALGIVCRAPPGGALNQDDVLDVTEYEHTPLDGHDGFFGTFCPKENPTWQKNVPGSLKFIKHRDVVRTHLLVFNAQVWRDGEGELRAHVQALRSLAAVEPTCSLGAIPTSYMRAPEHHHDELEPARRSGRGGAGRGRGGAAVGRGGAAGTSSGCGGVVGTGSSSDAGEAAAEASTTQGQRPVPNNTRVSVYWTEEPTGWYPGTVTSSRRGAENRWESRVLYLDKHVCYHFLDGGLDSVKWRKCDSSDEEDSDD